eukprot:351121-Chlamydomonas_euryale.AAC.7
MHNESESESELQGAEPQKGCLFTMHNENWMIRICGCSRSSTAAAVAAAAATAAAGPGRQRLSHTLSRGISNAKAGTGRRAHPVDNNSSPAPPKPNPVLQEQPSRHEDWPNPNTHEALPVPLTPCPPAPAARRPATQERPRACGHPRSVWINPQALRESTTPLKSL